MTRDEQHTIEDAIVVCVEDYKMTQQQMLKQITERYKVSPKFVLNLYEEMYEEE